MRRRRLKRSWRTSASITQALATDFAPQRRGLVGSKSWFQPEDGAVNTTELGLFIGTCEDESIKHPLERLRDVLEIADEADRVEVSDVWP